MGALRHHHYLKMKALIGIGCLGLLALCHAAAVAPAVVPAVAPAVVPAVTQGPGVPYDPALAKEIQDSITASVIQGIEAANKDAADGKPEDAIRATITSALQNRFIPAQQRNAVSDIVASLYHQMALQKWQAQVHQVLRTHQ